VLKVSSYHHDNHCNGVCNESLVPSCSLFEATDSEAISPELSDISIRFIGAFVEMSFLQFTFDFFDMLLNVIADIAFRIWF